MSTVKTKENTYKVTCRTKGTVSSWSKIISAPDKDTAFFRMADILEKRGNRHQTIIESIRKAKRETRVQRWARANR